MPIPILDAVPSSETLPGAADVVVIGGGIIGASAALSLAERRVSVVLCEKGMIGEQNSRAATGGGAASRVVTRASCR
jgi:glycine/D-amino acid oxidase-like deaminating enzyme